MNTNLRQCFNSLTVVGTLKSKKVTYGTTSNGDNTISLELTVASNDVDKVHENRIKLWAKNTSKLYNSYVTVANEYKTIAENGADQADRVKITGNLEMNEYFSTNAGEIKTYNNLKGVFVNRLDKDLKDEVGAVVECVITGVTDEISKEGTPSGRKKVNILTVGYNSSIHEIQNVVVEKELANDFIRMYPLNSTGKLYLKVNNYAVKNETEDVKPTIGFGTALSNMPDESIKDYVNEIVIVGGDTPNVANRFTPEQINEMKKLREMSRNEKMNSAPATPPAAPSGFGTGFDTGFNSSATDAGDMPF